MASLTYSSVLASVTRGQNAPIPGRRDMVRNDAGGVVFKLDVWDYLARFLILGTDKGTYYTSAQKHTTRVLDRFLPLISDSRDGCRVVDIVVHMLIHNRAPKPEPCLLILACCARSPDLTVRKHAYSKMVGSGIIRIPTHLFKFVQFAQDFGDTKGQGKLWKRAISRWYRYRGTNERSGEDLARLTTKYKTREGWTHRDLLLLAHVNPECTRPAIQCVMRYNVRGYVPAMMLAIDLDESFMGQKNENVILSYITYVLGVIDDPDGDPDEINDLHKTVLYLYAVESLKTETDTEQVMAFIRDFRLPREVIPTNHLNTLTVWRMLLMADGETVNMPITALIRNLGKMTSIGLLKRDAFAPSKVYMAVLGVVAKLIDSEVLKRGRVHPVSLLTAWFTYKSGHGNLGKLTWNPVPAITQALEKAFYRSFGNIEPTGGRTMLALDVSGSMGAAAIAGMPLSARQASAAMAMVTMRVEGDENVSLMGFSNRFIPLDGKTIPGSKYDWGASATRAGISSTDSLDSVLSKIRGLPFSSTDCSLPIKYAMDQWTNGDKRPYDAFIVYTDNETYDGKVHTSVLLKRYRAMTGVNAKLIVVGMTATEFTIADPEDPGMMDVVGFDTKAPKVMADFIRGDGWEMV